MIALQLLAVIRGNIKLFILIQVANTLIDWLKLAIFLKMCPSVLLMINFSDDDDDDDNNCDATTTTENIWVV